MRDRNLCYVSIDNIDDFNILAYVPFNNLQVVILNSVSQLVYLLQIWIGF